MTDDEIRERLAGLPQPVFEDEDGYYLYAERAAFPTAEEASRAALMWWEEATGEPLDDEVRESFAPDAFQSMTVDMDAGTPDHETVDAWVASQP